MSASKFEVQTKGRGLPSIGILAGVEGIGKTSWGCCAPSPFFLMTRGETGLETLLDAGRVPDTPHFPEIKTWMEFLDALKWLIENEHAYKTLVIDTIGGAERLCHEHVCKRDYGGQWGEKGFTSYMQGYEVSLADWRDLLTLLTGLRDQKRMTIVCLNHVKIAPFHNPEGKDYDRYTVDMHHKTWSLTHRWADWVLFANFYTVTKEEGGEKTKGAGGKKRIIYTERSAAWDAKNRFGLPPEIEMGNSAQEAFTNFITALKAARGK